MKRALNAQMLIDRARAAGRYSLDEADGKRLLAAFDVAVPRFTVARAKEDVTSIITQLTAPFAVKVMSPDILHKSDVGGVALGLSDASAVCDAIATMATRAGIRDGRIDGYLVEEMAGPGVEVVVGGVLDPHFGPMIMVGLGGIFVEILQDVAFRVCPITEDDARAMLAELRGSALLEGARGQAACNKEAIVRTLLKIAGEDGLLMTLDGEIAELDINPLIVTATGAIAADARFIITKRSRVTPQSVAPPYENLPVQQRFRPLFEPQTVAVVGASTSSSNIANTFIRRMKAFGYAGALYPIHPKASEVEGLPCCKSLAQTPRPVDYAYVAIGAQHIGDALLHANGRVRFAQVISSGFGEVTEGTALQTELVAKAHAGGCRVLGPNCLGLYSPRGGVTFPVDAPKEAGVVGVVSQSGGLGTDIIKRGQWRGVRFSGLVTLGNSADVGPVDLLEFYFADPQTKVIGLYLEDIKEGRRFFDLLRSARAGKPVVILRGGRSIHGRAAAASHTGALASDDRVWEAVAKQTACVLVETLDQFLDAVLAFQLLELHPRKPLQQVVLFGNGGGTGVLATDYFAARGLAIIPFDASTRNRLEALKLPPGTSIANPIDAPVGTLLEQQGRIANTILDIVYQSARPGAVVMHLNLAAFVGRGDVDPVGTLIDAALQMQHRYPGQAHFLLVLRVDGSPELDERKRHYQQKALSVGIPVYAELSDAAGALQAVSVMEQRLAAAGWEERFRVGAADPKPSLDAVDI